MEQETEQKQVEPKKTQQTDQSTKQEDSDKYISVKAFASKAGVSTQWVYKLLATDLQPYCKIIKGAKCINIDGLRLFEENKQQSDLASSLQVGEQVVANDFATTLQSVANDLQSSLQVNSDSLSSTVAALTQQLTTKDEQIKAKDEQIKAKDKQIEQLTAALQSSQEQQAALVTALTAAQALHAGTIQERLTEQTGTSNNVSDLAEGEPAQKPQQEKQGFFARIFSKKAK